MTIKTFTHSRITSEINHVKSEEKKVTRIKNKLEKYKEKLVIFDTNDLIDLYINKNKDMGVNGVNADQIEFFMSRILENSIKGKIIDLTHMKVAHHFFCVLIPRILGKNNDIFQLILKGNYLRDDGLHRLLSFLLTPCAPQLCLLNLNSTDLTEIGFFHICKFLEINETLTVLDLGNDEGIIRNKLGPSSEYAFEEALSQNKTLKFLKLHNLGITKNILNGILRGIKNNTGLVSLDLGLNNSLGISLGVSLRDHLFQSKLSELKLYKCGLGNKGIEMLSQCLDSLYRSELKVLDLTENGINERGFTCLFDRLGNNIKLKELILDRNPIKSRKIPTLSGCLASNTFLQILSMRECRLDNSICESFKNGLKKNRTLQILKLGGNYIYSKGADLLLESLAFNEGLLQLDLSGNKVSDKSKEILELALKNNNTLEVLNLRKNLVGDEGGLAVLKGVMENQTIRMVDLRNNTMLGSTLNKITMLFDKRRKVEKATVVQRFENQITNLEKFLECKPLVEEKLKEIKCNLKKEEEKFEILKKKLENETVEENKTTQNLEMAYMEKMNERKSIESKIFEMQQEINLVERKHIKELSEIQSLISKENIILRKKEIQIEEKKRKFQDDVEEQEKILINLRRQIQKCEHDIEKVERDHNNLLDIQKKESQSSGLMFTSNDKEKLVLSQKINLNLEKTKKLNQPLRTDTKTEKTEKTSERIRAKKEKKKPLTSVKSIKKRKRKSKKIFNPKRNR